MTRGFRDDDVRPAKLVDIEATLVSESHASFLIDDGSVRAWVPKSLVERDGDVFTMPAWLAEDRGFG